MYVWRSIQIERSRCSKLESQVAQLKSELEVSSRAMWGNPRARKQTSKVAHPGLAWAPTQPCAARVSRDSEQTKTLAACAVRASCSSRCDRRTQRTTHTGKHTASKQTLGLEGPMAHCSRGMPRLVVGAFGRPSRGARHCASHAARAGWIWPFPRFSCGRAPARAGVDRSKRGGRACSHPPRTTARRVAL